MEMSTIVQLSHIPLTLNTWNANHGKFLRCNLIGHNTLVVIASVRVTVSTNLDNIQMDER